MAMMSGANMECRKPRGSVTGSMGSHSSAPRAISPSSVPYSLSGLRQLVTSASA